MSAFWRFLRDKHNQQVLGWLGGGLVVLATGLWVAVVYFFPPQKSSEPQSSEPMPPTVQADCGGVAIGGNVSRSTITGGAATSSDCAPKLEEAVVAFREALKERSRERVPLEWARVQSNLGDALAHLGERESGTTKLEEAVIAYREALIERTRERVPLDWAMTQNNLGNALYVLGT